MNNNTARQTPYETPLNMLRRLLPTVGYTLSTDAAYMQRALWKKGMTNGALKVAILAWVAKAESDLQAHMKGGR